ncbi:potassium transporter [Bosea caraganae]|uniref:Potassium transporter n=1 Tax=Bosea caraganae TaxID=2763117 RepID=A0A370KZN8_9HYPH|nr:monovalent cation:proton antiporter-2 (CPA2) family protein [Bosea caraganae]RDJ20326.1 potassium transporter [Bosea caraganae]RDJ24022.1 potassium transporter [Bosea caraganae]
MATEAHAVELMPVVALLGAAVVAAPLFQRLGLGSVLGYLAAGVVIGPFGLGLLREPASVLQIAELGVVMFLFLIGLEMRPSRLWAMRGQIFGLGLSQVVLCAALLTAIGVLAGFAVAPSFVAGAGFVLTSTAVVMRLLEERGQLATVDGQRIVAILVLEDLLIVPLLAAVTFLAPATLDQPGKGINFFAVTVGTFSIVGVVFVGRFLLNPLFRLLANIPAREVMTAAALLVVLGSAYAMQLGGLSMAMGAFLAGVLLSESPFRHQLEADIDPFRGILLGLFFLAVGMSIDLGVVAASWRTVAFYVASYMIAKGAAIYVIARLFGTGPRVALHRAVIMAQGGEFAFVLYSAAFLAGIITAEQTAILTAIIIVSMALTPIAMAALRYWQSKLPASSEERNLPIELSASALVIGFGRVGQIASQFLLARGNAVSIIDTDIEMIDEARKYDFKVYFGDGTRLDILHAAGAGRAGVILVCVDSIEACTRIVELLKTHFEAIPVLARVNDRRHALQLVRLGVDFHIRETFESAFCLGQRALLAMGATSEEVAAFSVRIRERDQARFDLEIAGTETSPFGLFTGRADRAAIDITDRTGSAA